MKFEDFMNWNLTDSDEIFQTYKMMRFVISDKFHEDWARCYKIIHRQVSAIVHTYQ